LIFGTGPIICSFKAKESRSRKEWVAYAYPRWQ
jgi:hypothetical protein